MILNAFLSTVPSIFLNIPQSLVLKYSSSNARRTALLSRTFGIAKKRGLQRSDIQTKAEHSGWFKTSQGKWSNKRGYEGDTSESIAAKRMRFGRRKIAGRSPTQKRKIYMPYTNSRPFNTIQSTRSRTGPGPVSSCPSPTTADQRLDSEARRCWGKSTQAPHRPNPNAC